MTNKFSLSKKAIPRVRPAPSLNNDGRKFTAKLGFIAFLATFTANTSLSQNLSAEDISSLIDQRLAITNPYQDLLNDPDPMRSLAAVEIMIGSQDASLARLAIQYGLESGRPEVRQLAAASAYENWNNLSELDLDIQIQAGIVASLTSTGLFTEAVEIAEASLPQIQTDVQDISTVELTNNLAFLYASMGRSDEAEPLYSSVLDTFVASLGTQHPQTITAQNNLAVLYSQAGRLSEAEVLFEASLSSQLETLGEANPDTLVSMGNLAGLYFAQGRFDEAISLYRQTLEGSEITLGLNHPETTLVRLKLKQAMLSNLVEDGEEQ